MNTAKVYHDSDGNECSIMQMVIREPFWAANRLQKGEEAIEVLAKINASQPTAAPDSEDRCKECDWWYSRGFEFCAGCGKATSLPVS